MKHQFFIAFLLFLGIQLQVWPQDLVESLCSGSYGKDDATSISFSAGTIDVHTRDAAKKETVLKCPVLYSVTNQNLYLQTAADFRIDDSTLPRGRYLAVFGAKTLLLYSGDGRQPAFIAASDEFESGGSFPPLSASSELEESGRTYSADGLDRLTVGVPWAEGVKGFGLGQAIILNTTIGQSIVKAIRVWIINGFVSYDRPDLFQKNNRIKDLEVYDGDAKIADWALADTAQLQSFEIGISGLASLRFAIKAVYPGTKYDDTCLTLFLTKETQESLESLSGFGQ